MAITPTVMIAANGMLKGEGIGVNTDMTDKMSAATSNPISSGIASLQAKVASLTLTDPTSASALSSALSALPTAFTTIGTTASAATAQAASMAPDIKTFISLQSGATAFGAAGAEYGAALQQFAGKSFADLGVGVKGFVDANSGGLTSLVPGLGALANKAKADSFGSIGSNLDPTALLKGQASMASSALTEGLGSVSTGLKNFGTLFDFKNPQKLGYQSLVKNLQDQGLADSVGVNDGISAAGYDPKNLSAVPDSVLKDVLSTVQGNDLAKIISQMNVKPVGTFTSAADLVDPSIIMPAGAVAALGLKPGAGLAGLKSLGNTFTNIGVPMDSAKAADLLGSVQTKVGGYLAGLTELVPADIKSSLSPMLGTGSSPFGTPSMSDMMGSLAGKHTDAFKAAGEKVSSIASSTQGQALSKAMTNLKTAVESGTGLPAALAAFTSASASFASLAVSNADLSKTLSGITDSMTQVTSHMSMETSNLSLAGLSLSSPPTSPTGSAQILAFASKLHGFGVDKLQLGHSDIFNGAATNSLTGDAIKAALGEGKNVAAMSSAGKTPPSVSNTTKALAEANAANIDSFIDAYHSAKSKYAEARKTTLEAKAAVQSAKKALDQTPDDGGARAEYDAAKAKFDAAVGEFTTVADNVNSARTKMIDAATSAGGEAMSKATDAIQKYQT